MRKYIILIIFGLIVLSFIMGFTVSHRLNRNRLVSEWSSMKALHSYLAQELEEYKKAQGEYPEDLSKLEIPFSELDGANPEMLNRMFYIKKNDVYYIFWDESVYWDKTKANK